MLFAFFQKNAFTAYWKSVLKEILVHVIADLRLHTSSGPVTQKQGKISMTTRQIAFSEGRAALVAYILLSAQVSSKVYSI